MSKLPYTKEKPIRRIKVEDDNWDIKVYGDYVMIDRKGFEELLRRGRFYGLFVKVTGTE